MNKPTLLLLTGLMIAGAFLYSSQQEQRRELEARILEETRARLRAEDQYRQQQNAQSELLQQREWQSRQLENIQNSINNVNAQQRRHDMICLGGMIPDGSGGCFNPN